MNPSLLLIPDRYKAAKLYSQIPDSGAGDLTFARNSNATRVNSAGLIEKVRTNLQTYSQNFAAAGGWGGDPITATANYGTAPDGTTTSTRLVFTSANHVWQKSVTGINGNLGVFSLYIKGTAGETIQIAYGGTDKLVTIGTGWTRVNTNGTVASTGTININTYGGTARDFEVWGGQTELGDIATPYIPTTTAAVSVGITADIPRLDYTGGGCPSLLLEPQRTNLINFSEQLNNAYWTPNGATISANSTIAPDGTISMDRLTETATSGNHSVGSTAVTIFSNQVRTNSVFVKKGNVRYIQLISNAFSDSSCSAIFDLDTKTVTNFRASSAAGPIFAYVNSGVEDYGNGILRLFLTNTSTFDNTTFHINHSNVATFAAGTLTDGFITYSGSASSFTDLWGAQVEIGSYPTSYIPTLGSSVTRLADAASKTGISSLIGATEGTIYGEFANPAQAANGRYFSLSDGTAGDRIDVYAVSPTSIGLFAAKSFVAIINTSFAVPANAPFKYAIAYKAGQWAWYLNGVQIATSADTNVPIMSVAQLSTDPAGGIAAEGNPLNAAAIYTTRLSNAELASITTL
jgi:hypothetical protein